MPVQPDIALQIQNPNPTNLISGFLDLGQKKLMLDRSRQTFDADVARAKADSETAQAGAQVATATVQPKIAQQAALTDTAQTTAKQTHFNLTRDQGQAALQQAGGLLSDPAISSGNPDAAINAVLGAKDRAIQLGVPRPQAEVMFGRLVTTAHDNPAGLTQALKNIVLGGQSPQGQAGSIAPSGVAVDNGQQAKIVNTNPFAAGGVGTTIPGTSVQKQIPPTATTMSNGQPNYVGPQPPSAPGAPPVQSGAAIGQVEGVTGPVATNNSHYAGVQQAAADAPTRIGVLQSIKSLADPAMTGDAETRKLIISKIGGLFGASWDQTTATDVMAKETAMLAAKAGNTDLARIMNEAATPNGHMTAEAIKQTADQLIGQEKAKVAAQGYFGNTPTNSPLYGQKMAAWAKNGDPQAFEYASKTPAEQAVMKASMQKAGTWNALRAHMIQLHAMGIDPE